jgi:hypothetical protein
MSDDDPEDESATALRVKAEHCMSLAKLTGEEMRAELIRAATEYLERAAQLEHNEKSKAPTEATQFILGRTSGDWQQRCRPPLWNGTQDLSYRFFPLASGHERHAQN